MQIQITKKDSENLREYSYSSRPVEGNTRVFNKKKEGSSQRGGITRNTANDNKPALLPGGSARSEEHRAITLEKSYLTKKDNDIIFLNKEIELNDVFGSENTLFFLNINSEVVKDQYAIGKVALDIPNRGISKYRETQAYRQPQDSILEIYC
jgi:hypothetical protein